MCVHVCVCVCCICIYRYLLFWTSFAFLNSENTVCLTMEGDIFLLESNENRSFDFYTTSKAQRSCHWTWRRLAQVTIIMYSSFFFFLLQLNTLQIQTYNEIILLIAASVFAKTAEGVSLLREPNGIFILVHPDSWAWDRVDDCFQSSWKKRRREKIKRNERKRK